MNSTLSNIAVLVVVQFYCLLFQTHYYIQKQRKITFKGAEGGWGSEGVDGSSSLESSLATSKEEKCGVENGDELIYLTIFNLGDET